MKGASIALTIKCESRYVQSIYIDLISAWGNKR